MNDLSAKRGLSLGPIALHKACHVFKIGLIRLVFALEFSLFVFSFSNIPIFLALNRFWCIFNHFFQPQRKKTFLLVEILFDRIKMKRLGFGMTFFEQFEKYYVQLSSNNTTFNFFGTETIIWVTINRKILKMEYKTNSRTAAKN